VGRVGEVSSAHGLEAILFLVTLPPLLYAASEELPWRDLRAVCLPVTRRSAETAEWQVVRRVRWRSAYFPCF
jgi:hypothetical protein